MSKSDDQDIYDEIEVYSINEGAFNEPLDREYNAEPSHPRYDSHIDEQELYDEGLASASGLSDFANPAANARYGMESARYHADSQ